MPEHFVWSSFIQELLTLPELEYSAIDSPQAAGMITKKQWKLYLELRRLTLEQWRLTLQLGRFTLEFWKLTLVAAYPGVVKSQFGEGKCHQGAA